MLKSIKNAFIKAWNYLTITEVSADISKNNQKLELTHCPVYIRVTNTTKNQLEFNLFGAYKNLRAYIRKYRKSLIPES